MNSTWRERLAANETLLIDGGTGSELRSRGAPLHADVWSAVASLTHQDLLREIHREYITAGADVITTNTFGTSRFVLEAAGLGEQFAAINRAAVEAARAARDASGVQVAIAGSISCLPPLFDVRAYPDAAAERAAYRELAELLAELGVDFIALEMLQDSVHGQLACEAVAATGLPFWLGVSCRRTAAGALVELRSSGRLIRCYAGYTATVSARGHLRDAQRARRDRAGYRCDQSGALGGLDRRVSRNRCEPNDAARSHNAGVSARSTMLAANTESGVRACAAAPPATFAALALDWRQHGAQVLGGCCGTTPAHIRALRDVLAGRDP